MEPLSADLATFLQGLNLQHPPNCCLTPPRACPPIPKGRWLKVAACCYVPGYAVRPQMGLIAARLRSLGTALPAVVRAELDRGKPEDLFEPSLVPSQVLWSAREADSGFRLTRHPQRHAVQHRMLHPKCIFRTRDGERVKYPSNHHEEAAETNLGCIFLARNGDLSPADGVCLLEHDAKLTHVTCKPIGCALHVCSTGHVNLPGQRMTFEDVASEWIAYQYGSIVGFMGTRHGMTDAQRGAVRRLLGGMGFTEFHHGGCVGADAEAHEIALALGARIVIHPSDSDGRRAFTQAAVSHPPQPDLARNRDIVDAAAAFIVAPLDSRELSTSDMSTTVQYAREHGVPVRIVWPDGSATKPN